MPSFLARFRNRAISQSPTYPLPETPATPQYHPDPATRDLPLVPLDRKIRPDLNTLLEAYAAEDAMNRNTRSSAEQSSVKEELGLSPLKPRSSGRLLIAKEPADPVSPIALSSSRGIPLLPQVSQPPPPGGTFGRHSTNFLDLPPVNPFHSLPTRTGLSREKENDNSFPSRRRKTASRPSTAPNPGTSRSSPSNTTPSSRSSKSRSARISTPIARQLGFDSPRTLGYPTPPNPHASGCGSSPPPPLPPLDRLELTSRPMISSSHTFGKPILPYPSLPRVQSVFSTDSDRAPSRGSSRVRVNTMSSASTKTSRRSSAEWSAIQASVGVLSNSGSWPAEVSREILRLSLGETGSHQDPGNDRVSHVVHERPDNETPSGTFYPPALISSSLGSPIFLQGAEQVSSLPDTGSDHEVTYEQDKKSMSDVPVVANGKHSASTKGKMPLKSSLRMSSPPVALTSISQQIFSDSLLRQNSVGVTPAASKGKRKADEVDITPPDQRSIHAKFAIPEGRSRHTSSETRAPSSFRVKRARISSSVATPTPSPSRTRTPSNAANTGSSASRTTSQPVSRQQSLSYPPVGKANSRNGSIRSNPSGSDRFKTPDRPRSISSLSHASIPLSALVSPHAPSVSKSLNRAYHMQDPRKPPKTHSTPWSLRFRSEDEDGSPVHAWFFFLGFVVFPTWWAASLWRIPKTRQVGGEDMEKAVTLDDPQVEHDARSWRTRCRIMSAVSIFTYVPFIVLVVIFAPR